MNTVITIEKDDVRYEGMMDLVGKANEDNLLIVAKSENNRKAAIKPLMVLNGIYFYVANNVDGTLIYRSTYTDEEVEIAKKNTAKNAVIGDMMEVMSGEAKPLDKWTPSEMGMNILTSRGILHGAGILLCGEYLAAIRAKVGDYYILPSSVHEVIIVPKRDAPYDINGFAKIVREINADVVSKANFLSDEAFEYRDWV